MAILWTAEIDGTRYEVRSAGATRRLYTAGVFHSQFNPNNPVTGSVWDLLLLPLFFYPEGRIRRVLVLGVGGGAVIRQLRHFTTTEQIVGVELNSVHLELAERFFGVSGSETALHQADAAAWVEHYRGPPFDLIVDDLFGESAGEPVRAIPADPTWFAALSRLLTPEGAIVMNFASETDLRRCGYFHDPATRERFVSAFLFTTPLYENAVAAFLGIASDGATLRSNMSTRRELDTRRKSCRLRYRLRKLG